MCCHPNEVFFYSAKHNYPAVTDIAARETLRNSPSDFLALIREAGLHDDIGFRWVGLLFFRNRNCPARGSSFDRLL
jgi:hypothetical protein